jgi:hypothetical protein
MSLYLLRDKQCWKPLTVVVIAHTSAGHSIIAEFDIKEFVIYNSYIN